MPLVEINGVEMYYEDAGDGHPVVLIHGSEAHHGTWEHQFQTLSDEYRVIRYDYRGHGWTGPTDADAYSVELWAEDLEALIEHLDVESPTLCGHSRGGLIALSHAYRYDVSGLVLIGSAAPTTGFGTSDSQAEIMAQIVDLIPLLVREIGHYQTIPLIFEISNRAFDGWSGEYDEWMRLLTKDGVPGMDPAEFDKLAEKTPDESVELSTIDVPTLALYGEAEVESCQPPIDVLESELPAIEIVTVPEAGHLSITQQPSFVIEQIAQFVENDGGVTCHPE